MHPLATVAVLLGSLLLPIRSAMAQVKVNVDLPDFLKFNKEEAPTAKSVVAVFTLRGELSETPRDEALALFGGSQGISLRQLVSRMNQAADDPNVKAVVILDEGGQVGIAQIEEIRQAVGRLREAGRDVYVNADSLTMGKYVLFCGATRLSVVPTGDVWITGLFAEQPYLRGLLNKISVTPDFLTCGAYKSAAEMFMREGPSPEADSMMNWIIDSIYGDLVDQIAKSRNVSSDKAKAWIDGGPYSAEKARDAGLIDAVEHREQFQAMLKTKYGIDVVFDRKYGEKQQPSFDLSSPMGIFKLWGQLLSGGETKKSDKDAIGIVYVDGPIQVGAREPTPFGGQNSAMSSDIRRALDTAANDDSIKAVVLRIDSPGGSATASEIILDGTKRVKNRKPLVVSMGNVAGSGGYYVACGADTIFANDTTITGSIGVVGGKFATTEGWKRIGVTWKPYQRGQYAGLLSSYATFSPEERKRMQAWMDEIYGVFKSHVNDIRGTRLKKPIDEIAGGRVYTGRQALDLGLVDKIGTLQDAIVYAAGQAKLGNDYDVRIVPEPKSFIEQLLEGVSGNDEDKGRLLQTGTPSLWDLALPHLAGMDPQRVAAIKEAFVQLHTMQSEGVTLMTPPIVISK
jgi:protease-4